MARDCRPHRGAFHATVMEFKPDANFPGRFVGGCRPTATRSGRWHSGNVQSQPYGTLLQLRQSGHETAALEPVLSVITPGWQRALQVDEAISRAAHHSRRRHASHV